MLYLYTISSTFMKIRPMLLHQLHTPRLIIRPWIAADYPHFAALNADPEVMRYFPKPLDQQQSDQLADLCQDYILKQGWGFWSVALKDSNQCIGFVGLHAQPSQFSFSPCVEIGWRLAKAYWGLGYATEAASASLDFAFEHLQLEQVVAFTAAQNLPSEKVMQRLGMHFVELFNHPELDASSPLQQHKLYRIDRKDWSTQAQD
ncbi:RimJ/RimL family protein N-acetyltransferase [Acinetobacter calcoaceticus]|uniref:RimJ/RimL family protein N-acetyltransferase n=1 Tax=Acinetobacter calcoaceticus TaxID=471 RepID=A0A4V2R154_ACICA|nr:RimJ/RimL family protein N-acetyltransferase [Acinetobacter calcoaceticus]